jgi:hypothetical protein
LPPGNLKKDGFAAARVYGSKASRNGGCAQMKEHTSAISILIPLGRFINVGGIKLNIANSTVWPAKAAASRETVNVLFVFGAERLGLMVVSSWVHLEALAGVVKLMREVPKVVLPSFETKETDKLLRIARRASGKRTKKEAL